jgi:hypothetical protein
VRRYPATKSKVTVNFRFAVRLAVSTVRAAGHNEGSIIAAIIIAHIPIKGPNGGMDIAVI